MFYREQQIMNALYYGDNLQILRDHISNESVDLVYLDPPFNSNRSYNELFKDESGKYSDAQIMAFEDTWHWTAATQEQYDEFIVSGPDNVATVLEALYQMIGTNQMMAYLVMMTPRLVELWRVLKPTGSMFLHCDPTASHYLKIVCDAIFRPLNFRNEIVWQRRQDKHNLAKKHMGRIHDVILFYAKTSHTKYYIQYTDYDEEYIESHYKEDDEDGRGKYRILPCTNESGGNKIYTFRGVTRAWRFSPENMEQKYKDGLLVRRTDTGPFYYKKYLSDAKGVPLQDLWTDISPARGNESRGYPTQKPEPLLERIISASSNEGDLVLDPFCGCGTAVYASQNSNRRWIGIDITHLSIQLIKTALKDEFELKVNEDYSLVGVPVDVPGAKNLALEMPDGRHQFQLWAMALVGGQPYGGEIGKRGADGGIDGVIRFKYSKSKFEKILIQVKSGKNVGVGDIRDLVGTVEREGAKMGAFLTLYPATKPMKIEAKKAGKWSSPIWSGEYEKIQILTIKELLGGVKLNKPPSYREVRPKRRSNVGAKQKDLL